MPESEIKIHIPRSSTVIWETEGSVQFLFSLNRTAKAFRCT